jgi:hypothetical protein
MNLARTAALLLVSIAVLAACGGDNARSGAKSVHETLTKPPVSVTKLRADPSIDARFHPLSPVDAAHSRTRCTTEQARWCEMRIDGVPERYRGDDSIATVLVLAGRAAFTASDVATTVMRISGVRTAGPVTAVFERDSWDRLLVSSPNPSVDEFRAAAAEWDDQRR